MLIIWYRQRHDWGPSVLTNDDITNIITEVRQLWPNCRMVRGSPRHSQSNGGVERVNRTVQQKLGAWMSTTGSRHWAVGCKIVMWRYNTQQHRTIGDIPYRLLFGQEPRVGISSLHLDPNLLDQLATEAQLNRVAQYEGMQDVADSEDEENNAIASGEEEDASDAAADAIASGEEEGASDAVAEGENNGVDMAAAYGADVDVVATDGGADVDAVAAAVAEGADAVGAGSVNNKEDGDAVKTGELTCWETLVGQLNNSVEVDLDYIKTQRVGARIPIAYCMDVTDITSKSSFAPAILVQVAKNLWEVMDEDDTNLIEQLEMDGDDGIANMVDMYIRHPDSLFVSSFQGRKKDKPHKEDSPEDKGVTPRRKESRKRAHEKLQKAATLVKKKLIDSVGDDKICKVGEIVHVPLKDVDKTKVDAGNLTGVIVKVDNNRSMARVAVKSGLLKNWYVYHRLGQVRGHGNNVKLNGLEDVLANWQTMKEITEREAARNESMVGGQGKGDVTCNCKGACNSNQCSCRKAGRICQSACHRNNFKCCNHDRGD